MEAEVTKRSLGNHIGKQVMEVLQVTLVDTNDPSQQQEGHRKLQDESRDGIVQGIIQGQLSGRKYRNSSLMCLF